MQQVAQQNAAKQTPFLPTNQQAAPPPTSLFDKSQYSRFGNAMARGGGFGPMLNNPALQQQITTPDQLEMYNQARKAARNKGLGQMMYALSDAFGGRDIGKGVQERQLAQSGGTATTFQKDYQFLVRQGYSPQDAINLLKQNQAGAYAGTGMHAQYLNDLELGKSNPEYQKTSRYKVAYQQLHKPETYLNQAGQPVTRPGLRPGTYPNPFGEDESDTGDVVGISPAERNTLIKSNKAVDDAIDRIKVIGASIQEIDPNPLTFGKDRALIDSEYTQLQLELKNLFALGVLAGADLDLLEAVIGNPTNWKQFLIRGGKDGSLIQLQSLLEIANIGKNKNLLRLGEPTAPVPVLFGDENKETKRVQLFLD